MPLHPDTTSVGRLRIMHAIRVASPNRERQTQNETPHPLRVAEDLQGSKPYSISVGLKSNGKMAELVQEGERRGYEFWLFSDLENLFLVEMAEQESCTT